MLQAETQKAKMAAIEAGPIKVKVVRVEDSAEAEAGDESYACAPIVATFPHDARAAGHVDREHEGGIQVDLYASKDHLEKRDYYLHAKAGGSKGGGVEYVSSSLDANLGRPVKYVVGFLDRETRTLELMAPTHHASVAHFRVWRGKDDPLVMKGREETSSAASGDYDALESRRNLLKEFGSKKIKRLIAKRERTQIKDSDSLFLEDQGSVLRWATQMAEASAAKGQSEEDQLARATEARRRVLPNHDLRATTARQAYPLAGMLSSRAWESLRASQYYRDVEEGSESCDEYVIDRLAALKGGGAGEMSKEETNRALCLYAVLKWLHKTHRRAIRCKKGEGVGALASLLDLPQDLVSDLVLKFFKSSGPGVWECSKSSRISLKLHLAVLLLMLEGYSVKTAALAEELGVDAQEAKTLARELGCAVSGDSARLMKRKRAAESGDATVAADLESRLPKVGLKKARAR